MATRYAQASTGSPVGVGDEANDNQGERYESPVLLTGTSSPAGIGSWVSLSPNIHTSDSDLEAYQADNDDDLICDSPVEDQEENLPRNIEVEQEEALRASLSTILASSERPRFRQARERELRARTANRFRTLATNPTNPPPLFFPRDTSPHFNSTPAVTNDTSTSAINPVILDRGDLSDSQQCNLTSSDTSSSTAHKFVQPIIHHRTSVRHSRGSMSPPFQDKAEAMIERSFNISHSPRIVYSAPSSPPTTSFLETGSDRLTKSDEEEEQEGYVSGLSKNRRQNLNRQQCDEDEQSKTSNSTSEYESVSSLSLDEISDISRSVRKNWKKENGHSVDGSSDDGSKWYSGDITVKVWTAAVISGVLLGAGFGAGSLWRGSRAGHYTAAPA